MNESKPDILFILLDAARAENFSVYGYGKQTTPNLERLAPELAFYDSCMSAATWTLPSTASLFTGTYPSTHKLVIDGDRLAKSYASLPEVLQQAGYATSKVTGAVPYVSDFSGLDRGFDECWEAPPPNWRIWLDKLRGSGSKAPQPKPDESDAPDLARIDHDMSLEAEAESHLHARATLRGRMSFYLSGFYDDGGSACLQRVREIWREESEKPKFAYLHLQETHGEYRPPHRFRKRFIPRELHKKNWAAVNQRPNLHAVGLAPMDEEDFAILGGLYDGCISYMDEQIGALLDDLRKQPNWDNTLVIITADHGDCIGRHGVLGHQFVCYDELLRIPWIVKWPKSIGITGKQEQLVQNVDLLPTICGMLDLEIPEQVEAIDILSETREYAWGELLKPFGVTAVKQGLHELAPQYDRAVLVGRSARYKLHTYSNHQRDELYDMKQDPREENSLIGFGKDAELDGEARALCDAVDTWKPGWLAAADEIAQRIKAGDGGEMSSEVEEKLRALGYLD
ncbi:MAG: arylsulfatase A-like enzyme [Planctomycetota bacterium]|jgi:arylsulfatase A-like enzyme